MGDCQVCNNIKLFSLRGLCCLVFSHEDSHCIYSDCFKFCENFSSHKAQENSEVNVLYVRITAISSLQFCFLMAKYQETKANLKGFQKHNGISHSNTIASSTCFFPWMSKPTLKKSEYKVYKLHFHFWR